jgi:hypothetical protein
MASADFCILTTPIAQRGAVYPHFLSAFFVSYLADKAGDSLSGPGCLYTAKFWGKVLVTSMISKVKWKTEISCYPYREA